MYMYVYVMYMYMYCLQYMYVVVALLDVKVGSTHIVKATFEVYVCSTEHC